MTHPDEGPETADERDRIDAEWLIALAAAQARKVGTDRYAPGYLGKSEAWWDSALRCSEPEPKPSRPIANVRAAGVAVRFVLWVCAALIGTVGLAYAVAWAWE